ncbi:FecR domain-containing protein [Methyloversatilis sp. NSM2]|uniref:FecR domain-containing protein n=1 Tax=Methyloversatilis sp. NSM2 TaxID=3134135 RepID=UPI003114D74F
MSGGLSAAAGERLPDDIVDAAIAWSVRLDYNAATPAAKQAFARWLDADPRHAQAWGRVAALRSDFSGLPARLAHDVLQAAEAGRRGAAAGRRRALRVLSLSGVALASGWAVRETTPWQRLLADASTRVGEQRTLRLADGSVVMLNTDSAISADFSTERRVLVLRRGEIMITTGDDAGAAAKRPFWVSTPFGSLRALGTRFVVRLERSGARVSVQEGAVEVHPADGGAPVVIHSGERSALGPAGTSPPVMADADDDAWTDGVITGRDMRLADLLAELSRYRSGRIVCDPQIADWRVSGVFHVRDTDRALRFLAQVQPVVVRYRTRYWVIVEADRAG